MSTLFANVELAPRDPILGITEAFNADTNPSKVNLGVGVYYDDNGKVPVLECVKRAEQALAAEISPRTYLPIDGMTAYVKAVQTLLLGADAPAVTEQRVIGLQALGGTGALKLAADFLQRLNPKSRVWISNPSWENHRALFETAGFEVKNYPYYDAKTRGLDFDAMASALDTLPAGDVVVLHACCHNPTGADLTDEQWTRVMSIVKTRSLVPILDIAYQGFAEGLAQDGAVVRRFAAELSPIFIASSFSKSFSLYGERVGALTIVTGSKDEAARVLSQLKRVVRTNYSSPPTHGCQVVTKVLNTPELRALWEQELGQMRERIKVMRRALVDNVQARKPGFDISFVLRQRGMFSYSGLSKEIVDKLKSEHSIYAVDSGRICVAALNAKNVDRVAEAIAKLV
ncbi:MAG TPA: amino acid aminotransferase [Steroidobacteraceae bacterium]|nr:amino acid aminotransferase [Steroidobacteraceae bacterium]